MEKEEREKEEAMASNTCIRPNVKSSNITKDQLSKFQELQRRRLQMKSKSKNKKKPRGPSDAKSKLVGEDLDIKGSPDENTVQELTISDVSSSSKSNDKNELLEHPALKRKKLHWGLDTKERWERKANM